MYNAYEVLSSGLSVSRLRVNVIASNIANAETTRTPEGGPYQRRDVVQMARTVNSEFGSALDQASLRKPSVAAVVTDQSPPRKVFKPGHPDADGEGYVAFPNINIVSSMTDLMSASRLYEANVTALETTRKMMQEGFRIGQSV
jgi:flagellar basal-body rod protein FlgC